MNFEQPLGLWALLALVPFIILYLRKPKPKNQVIPSLMFLVQEQKRSKRFSFFQRFTSNFLFYLHLLILTLLALGLAVPMINIPYDVTKENTVVILDASASMNALHDGSTRFEEAKKQAKKYFSGRNTIILAENNPLIVLEDENTDVALDVLGKLEPKATTTNIGDALLLAKDVLGERPGSIILISDFLVTEGPDVQVVKTTLTSEDKVVDFVDVGDQLENVGIINLQVEKFTSTVYIKNFDTVEKKRTISIDNNGQGVANSGEITLSPFSIESFEFPTPPGISAIHLSPSDDFTLDDKAYLATPEKVKNTVVVISDQSQSNLEFALRSAPDTVVHVVNPPVLTITTTGDKIDPYAHDAIILHEVDKENILPGTFEDIEQYVSSGGVFIYSAQNSLSHFKLKKMEIIDLGSLSNQATQVCADTINTVTKQFASQQCFTTVSQYFTAEIKKDTISFASAGDSPIIAYQEYGEGAIAYYGIIDSVSDFKSLPSYPIFWNTLLNFMIGTEDIKDFNYATGGIATISEQEVTTPSSTITTSKLLLDEQGIYEFEGRKIAVNMLSEDESQVSTTFEQSSNSQREELLSAGQQRHDVSLVFLVTAAVFFLLLFEFIYIKRRGDI